MRFVLSVSLKYLIPKWRQLSVSIISLVSILVITLVVWLTIVFLSITEGIQKNWLKQLVSLSAPVRMVPTDAYYNSYYYKVDSISSRVGYSTRCIGEKLLADRSDPYDPDYDMELPFDFPRADCYPDGSLKDPVKMGFSAIRSMKHVRPKEYEVALGNMRLNLIRKAVRGSDEESYLSQISYFTNIDPENSAFKKMILPPNAEDVNNLLRSLPSKDYARFFEHVTIKKVETGENGAFFTPALYPLEGTLRGCAIESGSGGELNYIIIPQTKKRLQILIAEYKEKGFKAHEIELFFSGGYLQGDYPLILLDKGVQFEAALINDSVKTALSPHDIYLQVQGELQGLYLSGPLAMSHLKMAETEITEGSPYWAYNSKLPLGSALGDGVIISQNYRVSGVKLGDVGYVSYFAATPTSSQEQRLPIFVAGFYDPGLVTMGHKFAFADPKFLAALRGSLSVPDFNLGNGINIWLTNIGDAAAVKKELIERLGKLGIGKYWNVESYHDYEFVRPVLQQLSSDKTLFTLIAVLILLVACSNIISMLILLVNDKRKEIGVMRAMGASSKDIGAIFGLCGFTMGMVSCIFGSLLAIFTVHHIQQLVNILNFFKGHEMFQAAFFGETLPSEVSVGSLIFVLATTLALSIVAGLVPAIKAAKLSPTETLRGE